MARRGDGLYQHGRVWYLDCQIDGHRLITKLGKDFPRAVAAQLATKKRSEFFEGRNSPKETRHSL